MLSERAVQEYRDIARQCGVELTLEEAQEGGEWLIRFYEVLFRPAQEESGL